MLKVLTEVKEKGRVMMLFQMSLVSVCLCRSNLKTNSVISVSIELMIQPSVIFRSDVQNTS